MMSAPDSLLTSFLKLAAQSLESLEIDAPISQSDIRKLLLDTQLMCLSRLVLEHNEKQATDKVSFEEVQMRLKEISISNNGRDDDGLFQLSEAMNDEARLAYARLVLCSSLAQELSDEGSLDSLNRSGELERQDILEFCAIFQSALRLSMVRTHLKSGKPIFSHLTPRSSNNGDTYEDASISTRIESIRSLIFKSLGYSPEFAEAEMKRLFFTHCDSESNPFSNDTEVIEQVEAILSATRTAVENATDPLTLSDKEQGGVTRVVSVSHSETTIDPKTGATVKYGSAPKNESMVEQSAEEQQQKRLHQNKIHVAVSSLEEEIRQELLAMTTQDREQKLDQARRASQKFMEDMTVLAPAERIQFLQSIDPSTQRLMIMHKIWQSMSQQ